MKIKKKTKKLIVSGVITILLLYFGNDGLTELLGYSNSDLIKGPFEVVRVVDGDTLIIDIGGEEERTRLIGVDTPESVHPDQEKNTSSGQIASDYTKSLLEGQEVEIELDVEERDQYGRLLAYVYLDGEMINKKIIEDGMARMSTHPPNVKYVDDFKELQKIARDKGKGLWVN